MKFDKVIPKEPWTAEKTQERIDKVMEDIKKNNREINSIDSQINVLVVKKKSLQYRISNKTKYIHQLKKQLPEKDWQ